jgi:cell division protein FtsI/penicillin-binding protein 2
VRRRIVVVALVVVVVAVAGAGIVLVRSRKPGLARAEVATYLAAWERFDTAAMTGAADGAPPELARAVTGMRDDLSLTRATFRAENVRRSGDEQLATFTADLDVASLGQWRYTGRLRLVRRHGVWRVAWDPSAIHPDLRPGQRFDLARRAQPRGAILGADGSPIVAGADVVVVGLQPARVQDRDRLKAVLSQQLGTDPAKVTAALARTDAFVAIEQVPRDRFEQVRASLEPLPGVFFRRGPARAAPADLALLVGGVGEITAPRLAELGPPYRQGDQVGLSGLEARYERELAGVPSAEVRIVDGAGAPVRVLQQFPGAPARPVQITVDRAVQQAADRALADVDKPAALVALDAATGEIRAVVSRPLDQGFNRALSGRYPPGSSFKVVTTEALLRNGVGAGTTVDCPPAATVGGRVFHNIDGEAFGPIPFRTAFTLSCNTAFVALAARMPAGELSEAAKRFGFGVSYDPGVAAVGGQFPDPVDAAERAAAAIGQGRVLASPLHMASVAAAVASGAWRPPRLLAGQPPPAPTPLDAPAVATLADLMREVTRSGTAKAAAVPGQDVAGKTGTAEFGNADPPATHAWFIGFRGSLAFAVLVEGGGIGGEVAAPLAARFLAAVPA